MKEYQKLKTRILELQRKYPDWTTEELSLATQGKVKIGMDMIHCKEAWGTPNNISKTTTIDGEETHWCYGLACQKALLFRNGILMLIRE